MAFTLRFSGFAESYSHAKFVIYSKTLVDSEWTNVGENSDGLQAIPAWDQDTDMWVMLKRSSEQGYCLQQRDGSEWKSPVLIVMGDSSVSVKYEIEEWDAEHVIFHVKPKDYGADKRIGVSIPQSSCCTTYFDKDHAFVDGPPWYPELNLEYLIRLRAKSPALFVKSSKPKAKWQDSA